MALYTPFGEVLTMTRAEARLSTNPAVSPDSNTRVKTLVNRVYKLLYDNYAWPHLRYTAPKITISAGQRFYDWPSALNREHLDEVVVWWAGEPYPLDPGITFEEYSAFDSEADERADPPQRFDIRATSGNGTQIEIWPVPASNDMTLQMKGRRNAPKLVNPADVCLLDDVLVSTMAAAEILTPVSREEAEVKLRAAQQLLTQARARAVLPQTFGSSAPTVGGDMPRVGLRNGKAVVVVGRGS